MGLAVRWWQEGVYHNRARKTRVERQRLFLPPGHLLTPLLKQR